jgi:DNA-binding PadR family transcriptional regulator
MRTTNLKDLTHIPVTDIYIDVRYSEFLMPEDFEPFLPLSAATLHILLALSNEDRHGYAIMQEIARQSANRYKLGPGTLYESLQKLLDDGIVAEVSPRTKAAESRRRYYRLTRFGRGLLSAEIDRLEKLVHHAKASLFIRPRRAQ